MHFGLYTITFTILFFMQCNAIIIDNNGVVLPEVVSVFREYRPLIEEKAEDIYRKYSLSLENINDILNPITDIKTISLSSLNAIAQTVFLRPANTERKDTVNDVFLPYTTEVVMELFRKIGDIEDVDPKEKKPRYILSNGSTVQNMRFRLGGFIKYVEEEKLILNNCDKPIDIVSLSGDRDLFDTETAQVLHDPAPLSLNHRWQEPEELPTAEYQAARWVWEQTLFPDVVNNTKISFVSAEKKTVIDNNGNERVTRPTTADTVIKWITEYNPEPGHCVSISNQPYVYYQEAVMRGIMKKNGMLEQGFSVEGIGMSDIIDFDTFKNKIAVILDNFARTIYTEMQNLIY